MKFTVQWHPAHIAQVRSMNPWVAATICRAVYTAAETGKGAIQRVRADDPYRIRIDVPGAMAYAQVDPNTLTMTVIRISAK